MAEERKQETAYRRMTLLDRVRIQSALDRKETPCAISKALGRSPSSITREIDRHAAMAAAPDKGAVDCTWFTTCTRRGVCGKAVPCRGLCKAVCKGKCMDRCEDYVPVPCDRMDRLPGKVCNACRNVNSRACHWRKRLYKADEADRKAREDLVGPRSGSSLTEEELETLDRLISPRIMGGQSPYHISKSIAESGSVDVSLSTIYRLIDNEDLEARNIDLKEKVRRKRRKRPGHKRDEDPSMPVRKLGHLWEEFLEFLKGYDGIVVQMDCVEGKKDEPYALLTLHFPEQKLQLALWLPKQASPEVVHALDDIEKHLGASLFSEMFPVILTDNGHEFSDIEGMERSALEPGRQRTKIFFCEPNRSDEKGACENNHKLIRQVIPKGTSLSGIRQPQVSLMMDHVNSQRRKSLFGKAPMDVAMAIFPEDFFLLLGLKRIPDDKVCLKPSLIR